MKKIKKITRQAGYPKIDFGWFPSLSELYHFLASSKIGILPSTDDITWKLGVPLKLFDYMACGLPVVAVDRGSWWTDIIKQEECGLLIKDDPKEMAEAIDKILESEDTWNKMHENAIHAIRDKYNWNKISNEILIPALKNLHVSANETDLP